MKKKTLTLVICLAVVVLAVAAALIFFLPNNGTPPVGRDGWTLVWNDEFSGFSLDKTKWAPQEGTGSQYGLENWGNNEQEYYTADNISVKGGNLVIEARSDSTYGTLYTSGRIRTVSDTEDFFSTTYGRIEARIKMPEGSGLWPAFWMLPTNSPYGVWASSGEIDIMEARGRIPNEVGAAVHFGDVWPNNKYTGDTFLFPYNEPGITEYHVYALEWTPGSLKWFVDDTEYYSTNDWEAEGYEWPAPFDVDFHILLNLAVGGNFDGGVLPSALELPAKMYVDYIRVYEPTDGYDYDITPPVKPVIVPDIVSYNEYSVNKDESGNYLKDNDFSAFDTTCITSADQLAKELGRWNFLALSQYGGIASATAADAATTVDITAVGMQNYSVQLIQFVPLAHNVEYTVTFEAKASEPRTIYSKVSGDDDNSWVVYSKQETFELTEEMQTFTYSFLMEAASDATARLEFELGLEDPSVTIQNIVLSDNQ